MLAALIYLYLNGDGSRFSIYTTGGALYRLWNNGICYYFLAFAMPRPIRLSWLATRYSSMRSIAMLLFSTLMGDGGLGHHQWLIPMTPIALVCSKLVSTVLCNCCGRIRYCFTTKRKHVWFAWASMAHVSLMAAGILFGKE